MHEMAKTNTQWTVPEASELWPRAQQGGTSVREELRTLFRHHPDWLRGPATPVTSLANALIEEITRHEAPTTIREMLMAYANGLLEELAGECATALERLMAERVVATWMACHLLDSST
jgi:hypothetical protein